MNVKKKVYKHLYPAARSLKLGESPDIYLLHEHLSLWAHSFYMCLIKMRKISRDKNKELILYYYLVSRGKGSRKKFSEVFC